MTTPPYDSEFWWFYLNIDLFWMVVDDYRLGREHGQALRPMRRPRRLPSCPAYENGYNHGYRLRRAHLRLQ